MKNRYQKISWFTILVTFFFAFLVVFPFILNWIVCKQKLSWVPSIAGEPKDWIVFWGSYIASIASFLMIVLTYKIIQQNRNIMQGVLTFRIIGYNNNYALEISNIGSSLVSNISLTLDGGITKVLNSSNLFYFSKFTQKTFILKPNESKIILIDSSAINSYHKVLNPKSGVWKPHFIDENYHEQLVKSSIIIKGNYNTVGLTKSVNEVFCINDFDLGFLKTETPTDQKLSEIAKAINELKKS